MDTHLRLALTADLHWGINARGDAATELLVETLREVPPDILVLAGDVGAAEHFGPGLALFADLPSRKALVPGNHDIWVREHDARGDSLQVYRHHLPELCHAYGFHYLDHGPLTLPDAGLALAGSMNWYDYSWSLANLQQHVPDWDERLRTKRFTRGRHNDARFVRWSVDDVQFTEQAMATLGRHLSEARAVADHVIVITHHPPFYGLNFPRPEVPATLDAWLWDAFSGNRTLEELLLAHEDRVRFVFCGHTHRARENTLGKIRGYNIGGDYHFKRMLTLDWPAGTVEAHVFGEP